MPLYESVLIARQDISATQVDALADQFSELIKENGGEVMKKEHWGLKNLAYRIKKNRKGHYVLFNIDAPSAAVLEMERNMRISEDVIRYLTVRVDELEEDQSIMLRSRGSRDSGRGRRFGERGDRGDRGGPRHHDSRGPRSPEATAEAAPTAAGPDKSEPSDKGAGQ
jgi:small subunit ribosomal protein S6